MEEKNLSIALSNSLTSEFSNLVSEYSEIGLDSILEDGLLKDLPIVSTVVSLYKIGKSFRERHYISKLALFLFEFNNGIANEEKLNEYRQKIKSNEKFRHKELEYVLVLIDRYVTEDKPGMLAKLYMAYLDNKINWVEFTMYSEVIDRFLLPDCRTLTAKIDNYIVQQNMGDESILRLVALGLVTETNDNALFRISENGNISVSAASMKRYSSQTRTFIRTAFGEKLANILR